MKSLCLFSLLLGLLLLNSVECSLFSVYRNLMPKAVPLEEGRDYGEPLYLTPYITSGQTDLAKNLSKVVGLPGATVPSYSGYLTIREDTNSNTFFWFFPALINPATAPVLVWLQGGPGASSMYGIFAENGPWYVAADNNIYPRDFPWTTEFSLIYIDNPIGTGFSFTDSQAGYANDETTIGLDLYNALQQFFTLFSELRANDFYITGESYAGHYIPAFAHAIIQNNPTAVDKINFVGVAMGNAWVDPINMVNYGELLYSNGIVDEIQRDYFIQQQNIAINQMAAEDYRGAFWTIDFLIDGDLQPYPTYMYNATHLEYYLDWRRTVAPADDSYYANFLAREDVRKAIHVGNNTFYEGPIVETHLIDDVFKSVRPWFEEMLDAGYKVLVYTGQTDVICGYTLVRNFLKQVTWSHSAEFQAANRTIWKVSSLDSEIAGYVKHVENIWEVLIRDSGHIVPYDQPRSCYDMLYRFIYDLPFEN